MNYFFKKLHQPGNEFVCNFFRLIYIKGTSVITWLVFALVLSCGQVNGQNAIVGPGFSPGWGGACGTNTHFQYFTQGAGNSWIRTTKATGTGNQSFRLGVDWAGQLRQHTITLNADVQVNPNTEYLLNNTCTTNGSMFTNVGNADHNYVFKTFNANSTPDYRFIFFRLEGDVRTITNVSVPATVYHQASPTITISTNGSLPTGQAVYLRYSTDDFATSNVVSMAGMDNSYNAQIPGFNQGTVVKYYCFTSGAGLTISHANADFYTINNLTNGGLNYGYTVQGNPPLQTIAPGNWNDAATWENGIIPNGDLANVLIRHNVQANGMFTIKHLTIEAGNTLTIHFGQVLTIAAGGQIVNTGTLANSGKLRFAGSGSIANPATLKSVELLGSVDLKGSTITDTLEIKPGGSIASAPMPVYGANSTLFINTGGSFTRGFEWTTDKKAGNVVVGAGTSYTLCDANANAAYSALSLLVKGSQGMFTLDPLCNGNTPAPAGPISSVNMLTLDGNLYVEPTATFSVQRGDLGGLISGTRFFVEVRGNLTNIGTLSLNDDIGDDLVVKGNWHNAGTFYPGTNSSASGNQYTQADGRAVIFSGTQHQSINGGLTDFPFLILDNPAGLSITITTQVSRALTLLNGKIHLNNNVLMVGARVLINGEFVALGRINGGSATSYLYNGYLQRMISHKTQPTENNEQVAPNLGEPYLFPVGSIDDYRPFTFTFNTYPAEAQGIQVLHFFSGIVPGSEPDLVDSDGTTVNKFFRDAYWDAKSPTPIEWGNFSVQYTCTNCNIGNTNFEKIRAIRRTNNGSNWELPGNLVATTGSNQSPTVKRSGLTGFAQFGIGYNSDVLPVNLLSFTGSRTARGNQLNWISAQEQNFSYYDVQQSGNSQDWTQLARVNGKGSNSTEVYQFTHSKASGINYYRLRMVDLDSRERYSHVVTLKVDEIVSGQITAMYNQSAGQIMLQHNGAGFSKHTEARLMDIQGRILCQASLPETTRGNLNTGFLPAGIYLVQVTGAEKKETIKILVR